MIITRGLASNTIITRGYSYSEIYRRTEIFRGESNIVMLLDLGSKLNAI